MDIRKHFKLAIPNAIGGLITLAVAAGAVRYFEPVRHLLYSVVEAIKDGLLSMVPVWGFLVAIALVAIPSIIVFKRKNKRLIDLQEENRSLIIEKDQFEASHDEELTNLKALHSEKVEELEASKTKLKEKHAAVFKQQQARLAKRGSRWTDAT